MNIKPIAITRAVNTEFLTTLLLSSLPRSLVRDMKMGRMLAIFIATKNGIKDRI
jgi:hypothetical protein